MSHRRIAALAQLAGLCAVLAVLLGIAGLDTAAQHDLHGPPIDLPGWRTATVEESVLHDLRLRRETERAARAGHPADITQSASSDRPMSPGSAPVEAVVP